MQPGQSRTAEESTAQADDTTEDVRNSMRQKQSQKCPSNPLLEESAYPEETHHSVDRAIDTIARDQSQTWIAYESACKRYEVCYEKGTLPEILMLYEH